ncbi:MAG: hypothetical protein RLP44_03245 [Aggregatilineales bacterium]
MSSLLFRRIVVWLISLTIGFLVSWLIVTFVLPAVSPDPNASTISLGEYGRIYFLVTWIPIGLIFMTVFDYVMDTKIWPD